MKPHLCIQPQCPTTCEGCQYAVPPEDVPRQIIARLLCTFALTHDRQPYADGTNPLVDRARAYLRNPVRCIDRATVLRLAREAVNSGDGSELSGDAIERFAQLVFLEAATSGVLGTDEGRS